jgi:hypothetical protein
MVELVMVLGVPSKSTPPPTPPATLASESVSEEMVLRLSVERSMVRGADDSMPPPPPVAKVLSERSKSWFPSTVDFDTLSRPARF